MKGSPKPEALIITKADFPEHDRYSCNICGRTEWGVESHYPGCKYDTIKISVKAIV